jgi:dolichol-phosphate mannosyltransferase
MKVSIVLPTYNERENIGELIDSLTKIVKYPKEIIVVDDNSPDETWKVVERIQKKNKDVKLLRRIGVRGLASAIADGISTSNGNIIVWMDCDLSMPPKLVPELIKALKEYDVAIGSRYVSGGKDKRNLIRVLTSKAVNLFAGIFLGFEVKDYTTGFFAVKRNVLDKIKFSTEGYGEYSIDVLYKAKKYGFKIKEIPYIYVSRKKGKTKTSSSIFTLLKYGILYCLSILKLRLME